MTTTSNSAQPDTFPIRRALRTNASFSGLSGLTFIVAAPWLATWLAPAVPTLFGLPLAAWLALLGAGLLLFAGAVWWVARQTPISRPLAQLIIGLDAGWVLGSALLLLLAGSWLTAVGQITVIVLAIIVALLALWQFRTL